MKIKRRSDADKNRGVKARAHSGHPELLPRLAGPDPHNLGGGLLALREKLASVVVTRSAPTGALIDIPFEQEFVRETRVDPEQETIR